MPSVNLKRKYFVRVSTPEILRVENWKIVPTGTGLSHKLKEMKRKNKLDQVHWRLWLLANTCPFFFLSNYNVD